MCTRVKHLEKLPVMLGAEFLSLLKSTKYNQELWIFGESHRLFKAEDCKNKPDITIIEYLSKLLSKGKFYDVFIELPYTRKVRPRYLKSIPQDQIDLVNNLLIPCYHSGCPFKIRLHNIDVRTNAYKKYRFKISEPIYDELLKWYSLNSNQHISLIIALGAFIAMTKVLILDPSQFRNFLGVQFPNKIVIEIDRIDSRFAMEKTKLHTMYNKAENNMLNIRTKAELVVLFANQFIIDQNNINLITLLNTLAEYNNQLLHEITVLVDIYTLARMFHRFNDVKDNQTSTVERGIFFGGVNHSKRISNYLIGMGYTETFKRENESGCIEVPNID